MAEIGTHFMDLEDYALQQRLAEFLRSQYPSEHARAGIEKRLGRDIQCDVRTAKNLLAGHWPSARHLRAIVKRFGRDVWDVVFEPDVDPTIAKLKQEVRELEEKLAQANARYQQVSGDRVGGGVSYPRRVAATPPGDQKIRRRA
jgi:hypothetical protein